MSLVITVGRVTADFEMQMSANNTPYVRFTVVENIGYGENARAQYLQVWARAENAISLVKGKVRKGSLLWISGELELEEFQRRDKTRDKRLKVKLDSWRFIPFGKPQADRKEELPPQADDLSRASDAAQAAVEIDGDREQLPD